MMSEQLGQTKLVTIPAALLALLQVPLCSPVNLQLCLLFAIEQVVYSGCIRALFENSRLLQMQKVD